MYESDAELIEGCRQNDRKSQERLYKKYSGLMLGICLRYVKNRAEAEDVMMEGFMKVYKMIPSYTATGSFEGWIKRIMSYTAIEHFRKLSKMPFDEFDAHDSIVDDYIIDGISSRDILKLMNEMPDGYRIVLNMYAIEGYSHKEIADAMGISEGTSKSQLSRSKIFLRKLLEKTFLIHSKN
jgi:RNA polymerase sigma-70 factor (ECF subfamily)